MKKNLDKMTFNQLYNYAKQLKEGGKAWERVTDKMLEIREENYKKGIWKRPRTK